jgi:hypothetical protein
MSRPSHVVKVAMAILALAPLVQGCDSIVGEARSSADDGGGCGVIYIYVDGGAPTAVDGSDQAGEGGGQAVPVDVANPEVDGGGTGSTVDAMITVDQGAFAEPYDADPRGLDGAETSVYDVFPGFALDDRGDVAEARAQDAARDLSGADSADSRLDGTAPKLDAYADTGNDLGTPPILDVASGADGSDARDTSAGLDQGGDIPLDVPPAVGNDAGPDVAVIDVAPAPPEVLHFPLDVGGSVVVSQVSAGMYHTCGRRNDGTVYCWGSTADGRSTPPSYTYFLQITAGDAFNCGVTLDRAVACWGSNLEGQSTPPAGQFLQVATGSIHTCGIQADGAVVCWGYGGSGQCSAPAGTFLQISAGSQHTCGIQIDGSIDGSISGSIGGAIGGAIVCWGSNTYGESSAPSGLFLQLSARRFHTCAVKGDNTVACWGSNSYGESTPPSGTFSQVAAGYGHACGIRSDGTVACWGQNDAGQSTPPAGTFLQLSAYVTHTCGVRSDGTVACWGSNSSGQSSPP